MTPTVHSLWRQALRFLRELAGDDAYERYCAHHRISHPDEPLIDRRSHYLRAQEQKWGGINRCC
jgi:uncharacterized short protein YbdD (DUF466 family)